MPHNYPLSLRVLLFLFVLLGQRLEAQVGKAVTRMQEGKWSAAEEILRKALAKDTADLEARLLLGQYFFDTANPQHSIDSAFTHVKRSGDIYSMLPYRQQERLTREGIDSAV